MLLLVGFAQIARFIFLELAVEGGLSNSQKIGGLQFVAAGQAKCLEDGFPLLDGKWDHLARGVSLQSSRGLRFMEPGERQISQWRGEVSTWISPPEVIVTPRSTAFSSSRTLPGQSYCIITRRTS